MEQQRSLPDFFLLIIVFLLTCFGLVAVYSASFAIGYDKFHNANHFFYNQSKWAVLGFSCLLVTMNIPYTFFRKLSPLMFAGCLGMLVVVLMPGIGIERNNAQRWLGIGEMMQFQPSELMKIAVCLYFSHLLIKKQDSIEDFRKSIFPILFLMGICVVLIVLQPNFSMAVLIAVSTFTLLFVAGARIKHLLYMAGAVIPVGLVVAIMRPYRVQRLLTFLDPWGANQSDEAYQITNSLYAFGNGGITGVGFGAGLQKLFYLPEPHTDFIFSIIGEELGLIGTVSIVLLFALFCWRGIYIANRASDPYATLVAVGLTVLIALQAFMNMGIAIGLLPVTGMTLPFISYGGSSLLVTLFSTGIILNISRYIRRQ